MNPFRLTLHQLQQAFRAQPDPPCRGEIVVMERVVSNVADQSGRDDIGTSRSRRGTREVRKGQ